jgi:hypothetical protein
MTTKIKSTNTDFGSETDGIIIPKGNTGERVSNTSGSLRFNTQTGNLEIYDGTAWRGLVAPPSVTSISPTNVDSKDSATTTTFIVTGVGFSAGTTAKLVNNSGADITFNTVTRDSSTQLTCVLNNALITAVGVTDEPYDISVTTSAGTTVLENQIFVDQRPVFVTAAGSLGSVRTTTPSFTIEATDPESAGAVRYDIVGGSLPPSTSLNSSTGVISGTVTLASSDTTYNFTVQASDVDSNVSLRDFSITFSGPAYVTFTSSGTFSVPSGTASVDVLVVAGGGGGGYTIGGGGGGGGLIFRPGFPVTPGGTVSVTVGCGGSIGTTGQDSVFGALTAKGGGSSADYGGGTPTTANGGSGGGASGSGPAGTATQPTQPGDSGTYGFGNPGGQANPPANGYGGGGGGAGAAGSNNSGGTGGPGGDGRSYTIADGTTPVFYAGGGGGGGRQSGGGSGGQGGGGPGGGPGGSGGQGTVNRGGGGGGTGHNPSPNTGACGGKGVVIVAY